MDGQNSFYKRFEPYIVPFLVVLLLGTVIGLQFGDQVEGTSIGVTYSSGQSEFSDSSSVQPIEILESDGMDGERDTTQPPSTHQPAKSSSGSSTVTSKNSVSKSNSSSSKKSNSSNVSASTSSTVSDEDGYPMPPDSSNLPYNTEGNTSGNILNGGLAALQGSWIYYVNGDDRSTLYRMKKDGSSGQRLTDFSVSSINVLGEWVYAQVVDNTQVVAKIKIDGTSYRHIRVSSFNLCVWDDGIVSADGPERSCIYRTNHDYRTKDYLYEAYVATQLTMHNRTVYFINQDDDQLYAMDPSGGNLRKISEQSISGYGFGGADLFLRMDNKLYLHNDLSQAIGSSSVGCFNVSGQTIYYANLDDGGQLYAMNLDGSNERKLSSGSVSQIGIAGDWLFYTSGGRVQRIKL